MVFLSRWLMLKRALKRYTSGSHLLLLGMFFFIAFQAVASSSLEKESDLSVIGTKRVATLSPNLTELAYAAGAEHSLVGVSEYSDYPFEATLLPVISGSQGIFWESLFLLSPDLAISQKGLVSLQTLGQLEKLDLKVVELPMQHIDDIKNAIQFFSQFAQSPQKAQKTLLELENDLIALDKMASTTKNRHSIFFQFSDMPLLTVNQNTLISQLFERCGLDNIFAKETIAWPVVSKESVMIKKPDITFLIQPDPFFVSHSATFFQKTKSANIELANKVPQHNRNAFESGQVWVLNPDIFARETPRLVSQTKQLCQTIHKIYQ